MKEFVEKLIGRLEELKSNPSEKTCRENILLAMQKNLTIYSAIEIVNQLAEEYKNGWIPCSERLPETYEYVLVWCKGRFIDGTHVGEECEWYGIGVRYGKEWTVHQCKDIRDIEVLAWMLLPAQYQKGE